MDFVKKEGQNYVEGDHFRTYEEILQKTQMDHLTEYQHTPISMEQLHQAMQSTLNGTNLPHNLTIPLSPRQMSTLMLKTNPLTRNLHFNDMPYLARNTADLDILNGNLHEEFRINEPLQSDLQQNLVLTLAEQVELRNLANEMGHNLVRNDVLREDGSILQNTNELDLSQHFNRDLVDERRMPDGIIDGKWRGMPLQRPDVPFNIKLEQEDDGYLYGAINQNFNVNGLNGHVNVPSTAQPTDLHQDLSFTHTYNNTLPNINTNMQIDSFNRSNFVQNYSNRENPQNLVVHRQFENTSPYPQELKKIQPEIQIAAKSDVPIQNGRDKNFFTEYASFSVEKQENSNEISKSDVKNDERVPIDIKGEYICYKCNDVFPSKRGLKQHAKSCTDEEEKSGKFSCSQCAYRCQSPAILKIHERIHTGEKPFACTFCDYKSGQKNNVAKHILVHMKEKPYRCQYCDYRCAQKNNLVVHERTHTGYKPFACLYCDYRTVQKPNLVKHMYLHTDQKPFSCDLCNYKCVQKTNLTKHKQRHLNENKTDEFDKPQKLYKPRHKSVKCPHCNYRCVQKSSLDKHMSFKHQDITPNEVNQENMAQNQPFKAEMAYDESIQNLCVKKDAFVNDSANSDKVVEPLQLSNVS